MKSQREHIGNKCSNCGGDTKTELHHIKYDDIDIDPFANTVELCKSCHGKITVTGRRLGSFIKNLCEIMDRMDDLEIIGPRHMRHVYRR